MIVPGTGRCVNGDTEYESERTHEKEVVVKFHSKALCRQVQARAILGYAEALTH